MLVTSYSEEDILQQLATHWQNGVRVRLAASPPFGPATHLSASSMERRWAPHDQLIMRPSTPPRPPHTPT